MMHIHMTRMGETIRRAREAKKLTQATLAEKIDVSIRTIIAVEKNKRNPTYEVLYRLIHVLDISADLIFRPDDVPYTPEQDQFIRELLDCNEQEQHLVISVSRTLVQELRRSEPPKQ